MPQVSLSTGFKQAVMRALVTQIDDPGIWHIFELEISESCSDLGVDNSLILQIVQALEDRMLNFLNQLVGSAESDVLSEWVGDALQI
eukprot:SAG31_NODE_45534_length_258_cov_0.974843_1_plen_86_part_11